MSDFEDASKTFAKCKICGKIIKKHRIKRHDCGLYKSKLEQRAAMLKKKNMRTT